MTSTQTRRARIEKDRESAWWLVSYTQQPNFQLELSWPSWPEAVRAALRWTEGGAR